MICLKYHFGIKNYNNNCTNVSLSKTLYPLFSGSLALSIKAISSLNTKTPGYISFIFPFNVSFIFDSEMNPSSKLSFLYDTNLFISLLLITKFFLLFGYM